MLKKLIVKKKCGKNSRIGKKAEIRGNAKIFMSDIYIYFLIVQISVMICYSCITKLTSVCILQLSSFLPWKPPWTEH